VDKLNANIKVDGPAEVIVRSVSEHRGLVVLRGKNIGGRVRDTDPQQSGVQPLKAVADDDASSLTPNYWTSLSPKQSNIL
jgi:2,3-bisphosphoglycerate-independent phosphoglycerate mutase